MEHREYIFDGDETLDEADVTTTEAIVLRAYARAKRNGRGEGGGIDPSSTPPRRYSQHNLSYPQQDADELVQPKPKRRKLRPRAERLRLINRCVL